MGLHLPQEENKNNKMILRKISLVGMLELLQHLNDRGAEFIDIIGKANGDGEQDEMIIAVRDEYVRDNDYIDEGLEETNENPITTEYLNNLLGNGN